MPHSYSKSNNSDIPTLEIKSYRRKFRIFCGLSLILVTLLIVIIIFGLLYFLGLAPQLFQNGLNKEVKVKCNKLQGEVNDGIVEFLGIPYALPPVNELRFTHAKEIIKESHCRDAYGSREKPFVARSYKSECLQADRYSSKLKGSENCLYLNVYVPSTQTYTKFPVVFVINGLFFTFGSGNMKGLSVTPNLVKATKSIHVTCNYRLGPMNSFVNPSNNQTNHGLSDLLVALTWVHKNIANFNGDPSNVILYGVGSGSSLALALYNSNLAANLFNKLWISSPALALNSHLTDVIKYQKSVPGLSAKAVLQNPFNASKLFDKYSWNNVAEKFQQYWFNLPDLSSSFADEKLFFLIKDDYFITDFSLLKLPQTHRSIPTIIGNNANDVDLFPYPNTIKLWNEDYFKKYILKSFCEVKNFSNTTFMSDIENLYLHNVDNNYDYVFTLAISDLRTTCPINAKLEDLLLLKNSQSVYRYVLSDNHIKFDPFYLRHSTQYASYMWDSIVYFEGYKYLDDYGQYRETEPRLSALLHSLMQEFANKDSVSQLQLSNDGYVRMNFIRDGRIQRDCYLKTKQCDFWRKNYSNLQNTQWKV